MTGTAPTPLRVLDVIARMNVGGPALQVVALMRGLDRTRFDQRLAVGAVAADEADYLTLRACDMPVTRIRGLGRAVRGRDDLLALGHLVHEMRAFRPHVVHTHTAKAGVLGRLAAQLTGVPVTVHTFHGHLLTGYFSPRMSRAIAGVERALARRTTRLLAVGARVRDELLAARIGRPDQYVVMPPGVDVAQPLSQAKARAELGLPADAPTVAFVGRVTGVKAPLRFLDVARRVLREQPAAMFVVAGDGDLLPAMQAAAADLGQHCRFLGWRADVETIHAASDVALLTSDNEGMPVSLIEAALVGRAAVATDVGSVAEVVRHGVTGYVTLTDAAPLAHSTLRLLGDADLRRRMGHAAQEHASRSFGAARLVADTERLYHELTQDLLPKEATCV